jgi:hypothetical protein
MRTAIPNRRQHEIISYMHDGIYFNGQISYLPNGAPCEVFVDGGKPGSPVQAVARDSAVAISLALQHGTPLETLCAAMTRNEQGQAAGPIGTFLDIVTGKKI